MNNTRDQHQHNNKRENENFISSALSHLSSSPLTLAQLTCHVKFLVTSQHYKTEQFSIFLVTFLECFSRHLMKGNTIYTKNGKNRNGCSRESSLFYIIIAWHDDDHNSHRTDGTKQRKRSKTKTILQSKDYFYDSQSGFLWDLTLISNSQVISSIPFSKFHRIIAGSVTKHWV